MAAGGDQLNQFLTAVALEERQQRISAGLPPDHLLTFDDFPFRFGAANIAVLEGVIQNINATAPGQPQALLLDVMVKLARQDYAGANAVMAEYQRLAPQKLTANMRFGHAPQGPFAPLPKVHGVYPTEPALFLSCDPKYLEFAGPLIRSAGHHNPGLRLHLHLMGAGETPALDFSALNFSPLNFSMSWEDSTAFIAAHKLRPQDYYGSVRLVRFAEALETAGALLISDVDGLVTGPVAPLLSLPEDIGLRIRGGRFEPWHQFSACLLYGNKNGLPFYRRVADIIRADITRAWWGQDQYTLLSAYAGMRPAVRLFGPEIASVDKDKPGLFWFTASTAKHNLQTDQSGYAAAFRQFAVPVN